MIGKLLGYSIVLLLIGICSTASSSIGLQCSNENEKYKDDHPSNGKFLIVNLISAIFGIIIAIVGIVLAIKGSSAESE